MLSRISLFIIGCCIVLAPVCLAQEGGGASEIEKVFPHFAEVSGSNVYIRSGAGTAYYFCGKISSPDKVIVVEEKHGWSKIVPPAGSFSWISKNYVDVDATNKSIGFVTGDNVRVWAGSNYVEPMRSHSLQTKLNTGDQIELTGEEKGDYYKITPPPGAHLWISSRHIKYVGAVPQKALDLPPKPQPIPEQQKPVAKATDKASVDTKTEQAEPEAAEAKAEEKPLPTSKIARCHELGKLIKEEVKKPLDEQDYSPIKEELAKIAEDEGAGKAKLYAKFYLEELERYELAIKAGSELEEQQRKLKEAREEIEKIRNQELEKISDPDRFEVIGKLKPSSVYTTRSSQKRFIVVSDAGKIICYAIPTGNAASMDLSKFVSKKVGLTGETKSDPYNPVSLVMFSGIELVE